MGSRRSRLIPLALATMATQACIVVLAPIVAEVGRDLGMSISAVGQARTVLAGTAVIASLLVGPLIDRLGVRPLILWGSALAIVGNGAVAASPWVVWFFAAHLIVGVGVACLLSAGFAGVASYFDDGDLPWAMGYVVAAQSISWIVGNPIIGLLTDAISWRAAYIVPATIGLISLGAALSAPEGKLAGAEPGGALSGLRSVLADASARRWAIAELVAYGAWTAELTYAGAFYVETYDTPESALGFLLAAGSFVFMVVSVRSASITERFGRRRSVVFGAIAMGVMIVPLMNYTPAVWVTLVLFTFMATFAAIRSTGSSVLGLDQLPAQPGSMMAARTTSAQLGYVIGAAVGGVVLALSDFGALGFVLFAGMCFSALLVLRVEDPHLREQPLRREPLPAPVPD